MKLIYMMGLVMMDYRISYDGLEPLLSLSENEFLKSQDSAPVLASIVPLYNIIGAT